MLNIQISRHGFACHYSRMFWRNFTKIRQICIPYKFAQRGCIAPKIKCEILAPTPPPGEKPQTNGTTGPILTSIMTMDQHFTALIKK